MGKLLLVSLLIFLAAGTSDPPLPEENQAGGIEAYELQRDGRFQLLLRVEGKGPATIDQIVVKLPPKSDTDGYEVLAPASWTVEKPSRLSRVNPLRRNREPSLVLAGPATRMPVYIRLQGPRPGDRRVGVEASSGGKPAFGVRDLPVFPFPAPATSLAGLVRFPPLVSPGEVIEISPLDLRRTPPEGVWHLEGAAAEPAPAGTGRLRVRISPDARPTTPLRVTYTDPWGEKTVSASALGQVRVLPPPEGSPAHAQAEICGSELVQGEMCLCGWLPDEARNGFRVDGAPRPPSAVSRQSACFSLPPGQHQISGPGLPEARLSLLSITIQTPSTPPARPGQSLSLTWRVLGTPDRMRVQLRNVAPQVATLEGGDLQLAVTSGGEPNVIVRTLQLRNPGSYRIEATLPDEITPFQSRAYLKIVEKSFQRELAQTAERFTASRRRLASANARYYQAADVTRLIESTRHEIQRTLDQPEMAAFRDYAEDELARIQREVAAKSAGKASWEAPVAVPAAFQRRAPAKPAGAIEKKEAESLLEKVDDFLDQYRRKPLIRHLYIRSLPAQAATVRIFPRSYPSAERTGFTDMWLCNVPLGRYEYKVERAPYLAIDDKVDLIRDGQQELSCNLQKSGKPVPCRLETGTDRGCDER